MPSKILIIPARRHIIESYCDYLIRYLSDEFYFEMGYPQSDPITPLEKNPDDFDLIYPHFDTHWFLDREKYAHKVANVMLEMAGPQVKTAVQAGTSEPIMKAVPALTHSLRFGVDTEMFQPLKMARTDDLFRIGFIGNIQTPRRYIKELFMPLKDIPGVRLMVFPTTWPKHTRPDEIELMGGQDLVDSVVSGDCWSTGLPNIYNQVDLFIRCDLDLGYQFSVMEAAACGVPVITTDGGIGKELCDAGGGIYVHNGDGSWSENNLNDVATRIREAVLSLRYNNRKRKQIGKAGRKFTTTQWTWEKFAPAWREFFREGVANAKM